MIKPATPNIELQKARIAFANWLQARIGGLEWSVVSGDCGMNSGSFHRVMRCHRSMPARHWLRLIADGSYYARRWGPELIAQGQALWEATRNPKRCTQVAQDPFPGIMATLASLENAIASGHMDQADWLVVELRERLEAL